MTHLADQGTAATEPAFTTDSKSVVFVTDGTPTLRRVDLTSETIEAAFANDIQANHPRARPGKR